MSLPYEPLNVGDIHDDDAEIIDDLVQQQAEPPKPLADEMVTEVVARPTPVKRLQTFRQRLIPGWDPVMLFPKDEFRTSLQISLFSAVANDVVYIDGTSNGVRNAGELYQANPLTLFDYTGAIWAYNPGATEVTVSGWAVTK